ncbi:MAG TPA: hypothetical protein ENK26_08330, partial [Gammaproteobacteria bacterium]|nr:hypothetical protein [Gammaproteobacteria bacterium]
LQTPVELLASICDEFKIPYDRNSDSRKQLIDTINQWLLEVHAAGDRAVVIIDEAQNLNAETLEQIRLLTNLETSSEKLLKIILIGQPELKDILARPELRQLNQRITARYHLEPLSLSETRAYVEHRLKIAGAPRKLFKPRAIKKLHQISEGVPRIMNLICDRALTGAYGQRKEVVDSGLLSRAADEVYNPQSLSLSRRNPLPWILGALALLGLVAGGLTLWDRGDSSPDPEPIDKAETVEHVDSPSAPATSPPEEVKATVTPDLNNAIQVLSGPELESRLTLNANTNTAFRSLFEAWGLDFSKYSGKTACERAKKAGMQCLYAEGKLSEVFDYNLPAVLELTAHGGQLYQVALLARDDDQLTVDIAGETYFIARPDLKSYWKNAYLVIWRSPPENRRVILPGSTGPTVVWLRRQLDLAEGVSRPEGDYNNRYDEALRQRVKQFQASHGLTPDGIAGEKTLIKLQVASRNGGANIPVLTE